MDPLLQDGQDGQVGQYDRQPGRWLMGCVLVPVALLAVLFCLSTVGVAAALVLAGKDGPFAKTIGAGVSALVTSALLAAFFTTVARRLLAGVRGKEVPHLFPPAVGVVVGGIVGLLCVATGIAAIAGVSKGTGAGRALGIGVLFLAYAGHQARALWRRREAASEASKPDLPV